MADISHTTLVGSPLRGTDRIPLGRPSDGHADGAGTAYTATIDQLISAVTNTTTVYASKNGCALDSNLMTGGGTNDTAALQALLDLATGSRRLYLIVDGPALVTGLYISGNTRLEFLPGSGLYLQSGSNKAILRGKNPVTSMGAVVDKNIEIIGGFLNGNGANQTDTQADGSYNNGINFYGVQYLAMDRVHMYDCRVWGVSFWYSSYVTITNHQHDIALGSTRISQDGIDLRGPCNHFVINGARFNTYDDAIALNAKDSQGITSTYGGPYVGNGGAITDVQISNIWLDNALFGIDILSEAQRVDRIVIDGVHGTVQNQTINITNYPYAPYPTPVAYGNFGTISISNIDTQTVGSPYLGGNDGTYNLYENIRLQANIELLKLTNISLQANIDYRPQIHLLPGSYTIKELVINGLSIQDTTIGGTISKPRIHIESTVDRMRVNGVDWYRGSTFTQTGDLVGITSGGVTSSITINGGACNRAGNLITQTAGSLAAATLVGVRMDDCDSSGFLLKVASGALTLVKSGCTTNGGVVGGAASGSVTVVS